jgi:2-amino-4-hydroxy-6-hydroxymethyldihydropteridine diphosphokinase
MTIAERSERFDMELDATRSPTSFVSVDQFLQVRHTVYLALGSNLGDRRANLTAALNRLSARIELQALSSIYETEPVGYVEQPGFYNMACMGYTRLVPSQLLQYLKAVEEAVGRRPTFRNGPRIVDVDILFYDDLQLDEDDLIVPHPRLRERAFVLVPLAEIAPQLIDPISEKTVSVLLGAVSARGVVKVASAESLLPD